jgi:hypothetical protein
MRASHMQRLPLLICYGRRRGRGSGRSILDPRWHGTSSSGQPMSIQNSMWSGMGTFVLWAFDDAWVPTWMCFVCVTCGMLDSRPNRGEEAAKVEASPANKSFKRILNLFFVGNQRFLSRIRLPACSERDTSLPSRPEAAPLRAALSSQPPTLHELCRTCTSRALPGDRALKI